jgi:UDP-N-acetyl-D-mannosaminuronate dehydrogenase
VAPGSLDAIVRLYSPVFNTIVPVSKPEVAEMMKLYENCQRMMCIAFANEMADACTPFGVDPYEVCRAAATKPFGYMPYMPSLGVGGHCIPVNPYYLLSNGDFPLLKACTEKMWQRPIDIGQRALRTLLGPGNEDSCPLTTLANLAALERQDSGIDVSYDAMPDAVLAKANLGLILDSISHTDTTSGTTVVKPLPRVLVVGMGFKAGQSVLSNSPGLKLAQTLDNCCRVSVMWADPLVEQMIIPQIPRLSDHHWTKDMLETFDMIIVAVKQVGLDFSILQILHDVNIQFWCP